MTRISSIKQWLTCTAMVTAGMAATQAQAVPLVVVNPSFETPSGALISVVIPSFQTLPADFAVPTIASAFNVDLATAQSLFGWQTAGTQVTFGDLGQPISIVPVVIFNNSAFSPVPQVFITNADGDNVAALQATEETFLFQLLSDTYQVGRSYDFTAALGKSSTSRPEVGSKISLEFFYLDDQLNTVVIQSLEVDESDLDGTSLIDRSLVLAQVAANDPWAGKQIGIRFGAVETALSQAGGGFLNFDNARVEARGSAVNATIPEPATFGALALAASIGLMRRRRLA